MRRREASVALCGFCAATLRAPSARADATLSQRESTAYYVTQGSLAGAAFIASAVIDATLSSLDDPPRLDSWLTFEAPVNGYMSATAASWSDRFVFAAIAVPVFAEVGDGVDRQLANHAIVYGQAIGFQLLLNVGVKYAVRRARPYTHNREPRVEEFRRSQGADADLSFYSGHASAAFAAALSGSYLFAAKTDDAWSRRIVWFSELGFASAAAHLRVRAGMHYYSDVIVGTLVGSAFGLAVPYLHGERYRPDAGEYGAAAAGFAVGAIVPLFVRTTDVRLEWGGHEVTTLHVGPWIPPGGAGVSVTGRL